MNNSKERRFSISRRNALKAGFAAGAALAMPQIMTRAAQAAAPMLGGAIPEFYRFKLGDFEITTIRDGTRASEGPYPTFGGNMAEAEVHALLRQNGLPEKSLVNGFTPTIINTGNELVLFDTGLGAGARGNGMGNTHSILAKAGYAPEQVDIVVITHFHPDHIGGLMENNAPAYPNARYVMGETEYGFWTHADRMSGPTERVAKMVDGLVKPIAEKTTFVKEGGAVVSGITAFETFGHTPGHMAFQVESAGKRLVITADTANHYVISLQKPDWEVAFDSIKPVAAATRRKVFGMIAADRVPFIGYHMPWPSIGYVETMGDGFRYVPHSYQLDL